MSGFCKEEIQREITEAGADTLLSKPLNIDLMLKIIGLDDQSNNMLNRFL